MVEIRNTIETLFERLGHLLYQNPLKALLIVFLFSGALVSQFTQISFDSSPEGFFRENNPNLLEYHAFRNQFGQPDLIFIAVKPPEVFEADFLEKLKVFHDDLQREVPHLRKVTSLINTQRIRAEGDVLFVEELLGDWPEKDIDFASLRKLVLSNPAYVNHIISEDGRITGVLIETESYLSETYEEENLLSETDENTLADVNKAKKPRYFSGKDTRNVVDAIHAVVSRHRSPDFLVSISGAPFIFDVLDRYQIKDCLLCMILSNLVVIFFLAIFFRSISGVVLPLLVVNLAWLSTVGLMVLFDVPIRMTTVVLPAFLLAVGVADSVHILAIFYRQLQKGHGKEDAIAFTLGHSGPVIVMTSITTAAALMSFSFAEVTAIGEMGIFSAVGVILALLYSIFMLPGLLAVIPIKPNVREVKRPHYMDCVLLSFAAFSTRYPVRILVISLVILALSAVSISRVHFSHDVARFFPDGMTVKKDLTFIDRIFKGILTLEVIVDTNKENGIYDPGILNRIEKLSDSIGGIRTTDIFVGKIFSINDIIKETNQALHENDNTYYTIPQDRKAIAQELLLLESIGADGIERLVDSEFSKARITIKTSWVGAVVGNRFREKVQQQFRTMFQHQADISITGMLALWSRTLTAAIHGMAKSYVIAFLVITIMMILFVGKAKIGLLAMIPNLLPILLILGFMGLAEIPLDMCSLLIGSIALGLVVDDTLHFIYNFQGYYDKLGDSQKAVQETLLSTGRAILITSLVLSAGFFVLLGASLEHTVRFGFFSGMVVLLALLTDFLVLPALLVLVTRSEQR